MVNGFNPSIWYSALTFSYEENFLYKCDKDSFWSMLQWGDEHIEIIFYNCMDAKFPKKYRS